MSVSDPIQQLVTDWYQRVRESQFSHYSAARYYSKLHYFLGIPVVILSGIVGTSIFASIGQQADRTSTILIGLISLLIAVLGALQTFLRFSERAEKHRIAGARYGEIRREIEQVQALPLNSNENLKQFLDGLRERMDGLASEAPQLPSRFWVNREAFHLAEIKAIKKRLTLPKAEA